MSEMPQNMGKEVEVSEQKQAQDEITERLDILYRRIKLYGEVAADNGLDGFEEDDLSLIRWAFGITKEK